MRSVFRLTLSLTAAAGLVLAQDAPQNAPQPGWTPVGQSPSARANTPAPGNPQPAPAAPQAALPARSLPPQLTLKSGSYITVRVNQKLSSDHNQPGDGFTATLLRPLVVGGFVVANPGQTIGGEVVEAQKAGHGASSSRLGIQLTDLTLVDGQQLPIQSALVAKSSPSHAGRDAAAIVGSTGIGALIGGAAGGGVGAAIGAGIGAVASTAGVVATKGGPSVIKPESILTFRVNNDVTFDTTQAPQAFRPVSPNDYNRGLQAARPRLAYPGYGYPYYGYPYYAYPYPYWGPGVGVYFGGVWGRRWR